MAADQNTPKDPERGQGERQVSSLFDYLQSPINRMQQWVSSGQLQSTIEQLQERAAQLDVGRRLRALDEVRQGVQIHVKKQLEAYQQQNQEQSRVQAPPVQADAPPVQAEATPQPKPKPKPKTSAKKARGKKTSGTKP